MNEEFFFYSKFLQPIIANHADLFPLDEQIDPIGRRLVALGYQRFTTSIDRALSLIEYHGISIDYDFEDKEDEYYEESPAAAIGATEGDLRNCYAILQDLIDKEEYEDAYAIALFLVTLNPYAIEYWVALGIIDIHQGNYYLAAAAFGAALEYGASIDMFIYAISAFVQKGEIVMAQQLANAIKPLVSDCGCEYIEKMERYIA